MSLFTFNKKESDDSFTFGGPPSSDSFTFGGRPPSGSFTFGGSPTKASCTFGTATKPVISNQFRVSYDKSTQTDDSHVTKCMQFLTELLQSGQYSDVILNVKGKEFKVHSKILSAHSPVFAAMMTHDTKEKATGVVNIDDCEPEVFNDFLQYLYSGSLNLNSEKVAALYAIADKYQVNEFSKTCVTYMKTHISLETFCDVMALSLRYHEQELIELATDYFVRNSIAISKTAQWLDFMKENLVAGNELFLKALESKRIVIPYEK